MKDQGPMIYDKQGTWQNEGSSQETEWPNDEDFLPRTDNLTVKYEGKVYSIKFNNVVVDNNDGDEPEWSSGSIVVESEVGRSEYYHDSGVPFALFMSDEAFLETLK